MSDPEKIRARCEAHDMAYDPALHTGCILCRKEQQPDQEGAEAPKRGAWPYIVATLLVAVALGGIGLGVYGHRTQRTARDAEGATASLEGATGANSTDESTDAQFMLGRVGTDHHGYPNDLPNKLTLLDWLRNRQYRALTAALESLQDEANADFHKERWPTVAFEAFRTPARRLGRRFDAWTKAEPGSFAPYLARAQHKLALARRIAVNGDDGRASKKRLAKMRKAYSAASKDVDQALELRPDLVDAHVLRLIIATDRGADVATRTQIIEEALQQCAYCVGPRAAYLATIEPSRGGSHDLMKKKAQSWQYLSENSRLRQLLGYVDADLCESLVDQDPERALAHCDRALRTGANADFLAAKARTLAALGRHDEAVAAFDEVLAIAPQDARALADRGLSLQALERYDDTASDLALAVRLDPADAESESNLHDILEKLARAAYYQAEAGEVDDAIANYDRVLDMDPRYADALAYRGVAYAKKNDLDQAERDLLNAIKLDPRNLEAYRGLDALLFRQDRLDELVAHWNRYLKRKPKDATALFKRSGAHYHKGETELAMRDVKAACKLGNDEACAMQHRFSSTN